MIRKTFSQLHKNSTFKTSTFSSFSTSNNNKTTTTNITLKFKNEEKTNIKTISNYSASLYLTDLIFLGDFDLDDGKYHEKKFHISFIQPSEDR